MHPQWAIARLAVKWQIPFIVTPHNMLGGWLWRRGPVRHAKKILYWHAMAYPVMKRAAVIHALSEREKETLSTEFFTNQRIEVIPNAVDLARIDKSSIGDDCPKVDRPYVLFLGRLHPVKGVDLLIDAFAHIKAPFDLMVAGPDGDPRFSRNLRERAARLDGARVIRFVGPVYGNVKWSLIRRAWCLAAPSYSEGISMSVLEALACATPVIASKEAGVQGLHEGGSILTELTVDAIAESVTTATNWSFEDRRARGRMARRLAEEQYSTNTVARRYVALYQSLH